jgi:predicted metal-dependent phosphoesterase TrpH
MIKADLHLHTSDDPEDRIPHSADELVTRAAALGYGALAVTLHNRWWDPAPVAGLAAERGIVMLPSIERTIDGRHVLLINVTRDAERVRTFADLAAFRADSGALVIAPHPYYPLGHSLGSALERHADVFDAVEHSGFYVRGLDFNRRAVAWARAHGKPLVGNADLHRLEQLGATYSLIDAQPTPDAICAAIRAGRVRVESRPLGWVQTGLLAARMELSGLRGRPRR